MSVRGLCTSISLCHVCGVLCILYVCQSVPLCPCDVSVIWRTFMSFTNWYVYVFHLLFCPCIFICQVSVFLCMSFMRPVCHHTSNVTIIRWVSSQWLQRFANASTAQTPHWDRCRDHGDAHIVSYCTLRLAYRSKPDVVPNWCASVYVKSPSICLSIFVLIFVCLWMSEPPVCKLT